MPSRAELSKQVSELGGWRKKYGMLIHSVPRDLGRGGLRRIVERVRRDVKWAYVTDREEDVYGGFSGCWEE